MYWSRKFNNTKIFVLSKTIFSYFIYKMKSCHISTYNVLENFLIIILNKTIIFLRVHSFIRTIHHVSNTAICRKISSPFPSRRVRHSRKRYRKVVHGITMVIPGSITSQGVALKITSLFGVRVGLQFYVFMNMFTNR